VIRGRSEQDERVRVLHLTEEGQALRQQAEKVPEMMRCKVGGDIEQLQQLKSLCDNALKILNSDKASSCEM